MITSRDYTSQRRFNVQKLMKQNKAAIIPVIILFAALGVVSIITDAVVVYAVLLGILVFGVASWTIKDFPLYASVALYAILPQYFGIEISSGLPLITASRIIILYLFVYCLIKGKLKKNPLMVMKKAKLSHIIGIYVLLFFFATVPFLRDMMMVKDFFSVCFDEILLFILLTNAIDTEEKLRRCVFIIVAMFGIVCIGGICESLTGYNIWDNFYTITRQIANAHYSRLGISRASFSFSHSIYFGMYIGILIPFVMYFIKNKKKNFLYKVILILGIITCCLTVARGQIAVMFLSIVLNIFGMNRKEYKRFRNFFLLVACSVLLCMVAVPQISELFFNIIKSVLNEFGMNYTLTDFGSNSDGIESRLYQFQVYGDALREHWLFGIGSGSSAIFQSVDNGYLGWMLDGGVVKLLGKIVLYAGSSIVLFKNRKKNQISRAAFYSFFCYMVALLAAPENITTKMLWIVLSLAASSICLEERKEMRKVPDERSVA